MVGGARFALAIGQQSDHAQDHRQQHHGGRRVGHPHADARGDQHEGEHDARRRGADLEQREIRQPAVQFPLLQRLGQHEAAEEQVDEFVGVGRGGFPHRQAAHDRKDHQWQQRGGVHRDGLGHPPHRHPHRRGRGHPARPRQSDPLAAGGHVGLRHQPQGHQGQRRPGDQADAAHGGGIQAWRLTRPRPAGSRRNAHAG
jgi:hypothetical protein